MLCCFLLEVWAYNLRGTWLLGHFRFWVSNMKHERIEVSINFSENYISSRCLCDPKVGIPLGTGTSGPEWRSFRPGAGQRSTKLYDSAGGKQRAPQQTPVGPVSNWSELRGCCVHLMPVLWGKLTFPLLWQTFAAVWQLCYFWLMQE